MVYLKYAVNDLILAFWVIQFWKDVGVFTEKNQTLLLDVFYFPV